jgi:hypothetical protein
VRVISAGPPAGSPGREDLDRQEQRARRRNPQARAPWLLFTDADTIHQTGSLARALDEAKREQADLLSYSPEQVVVTFAERAVMPVVFAELAARYPLKGARSEFVKVLLRTASTFSSAAPPTTPSAATPR